MPRCASAALAALHFRDPRTDALRKLSEREWREALDFCDRSRLTLFLRDAAGDALPPWVRERTGRDAANNLERLRGLESLHRDLAGRLTARGVDFLALKGITHGGLFGFRPDNRMQYDIDLFSPREAVHAARAVLLDCGFEPLEQMEDFPTDHLPVMVRPTTWEWRGDYFDTGIPTPVELHFQFWNADLERLPASGVDEFWTRRGRRCVAGIELAVLCPADALAYAALHALKHVLRGSLCAFHAFEIACFLESHAGDHALWKEWRALHSPQLRRLEAVVFRLAAEWFGCAVAELPRQEMEDLPGATRAWFAEFSASPVTRLFHSDKDELWLHFSLLDSRRDAWSVARRRLLPGNLPPLGYQAHVPTEHMTWRRRLRGWARYAAYGAQRARHHALALPHTATTGGRWWWKTNRLGRTFWTFLAAAVLFNFGLFIFVLLYNLYLLDMGFREDFVGVINGAARAGSVAGTLPAALLARRFGLRRAMAASIGGIAAVMAARALVVAQAPLTALAFVEGALFSLWAVIMAPLIAAAVKDERRPLAFSIFFASMFATGIAGNWMGGWLPVWLHGKQVALLLSTGLMALAVGPALWLKLAVEPAGRARIYPRSRFLVMFLIPFALWHLATGTFNPFNNVYFAHLKFPVERIGAVFSASQVVQVGAVLAAPVVFRRRGLVTGIMWMMAAAAFSMGGLAAQFSAAGSVAAYIAYMSFQWMSEPGLNTLLMNHVDERERGGASALNYLVAFGAQTVAAFGAGALLARWGYGPVLAAAAALAALAAALFHTLLRKTR